MNVLTSITVLGFLIFFHEMGHFLAAILQGIHVDGFSIGFGPSIIKKKIREVTYSLRAFPLGGFVSFPDADDIEALFTSQSGNIGTGDRSYFIVDRTKIVQDLVKYEIQASQSNSAVEGMACEDPFVFGYSVSDSLGTPLSIDTYYKNTLNFIKSDSISKLPGAVEENDYFEVPKYEIITPVDKWSDQFKGIRFKMKNK